MSMNKWLQRNFEMYFPFKQENIDNYHANGDFEVIIKMKDGTNISYDDVEKSFRRLPKDSSHMSKEECLNEFGVRLRKVMCRKGISQLELSNITGIQQSILSDYMNGKKSPTLYKLDKIARALDCSVDEFRYL